MKKILGTVAFVATLAATAPASAGITVLGTGVLSPLFTVETFDNVTPGLGVLTGPFTGADGGVYTGFGTVVNGSVAGHNAAPYFGPGPYSGLGVPPPVSPTGQDGSNYITMGPDGSPETITYASPKNTFGLYWGSVDLYNHVDFYLGGVLQAAFTGADVAPLLATGCQTDFGCNGYVEFTGLNFDKVVLGSIDNFAFEADNIGATTSGVPELSTWLMMLIGFGGIGFLAYRRTKKSSVAFAAA
jgi:fibronectin-binding autotransporter adhesin